MTQGRQALIEAGLGRAAEALGDVTQPVIDQFYSRFPMPGPASRTMRCAIRPALRPRWSATRSIM
ncbi:MAG: hypothetical protein K2W91_02695 [Novosphingobium sp.]|nr:hypothetical protein [Novosphingobium sp.]